MSPPIYEAYAVKYADRIGTRGTIFVHGDPHDAPLAMDYFVWAVRSAERAVVIDVGFTKAEAERRARNHLRCPTDGLRLIGVEAADIEDVIVTHMHYDHAGNLELFPNARFHIQDAEMAFVTGRAMTHPAMRHSFVVDDVVDMIRVIYGDRAVFHNGDEEIAPGLWVHHIPGHTPGMQSVRVHTKRGWVILASDASHYYESITDGTPFATHDNMSLMLDGFRRLRALAPSDAHIVPGHDPLVMSRYPAPTADLDGIVVQLDVAPKA